MSGAECHLTDCIAGRRVHPLGASLGRGQFGVGADSKPLGLPGRLSLSAHSRGLGTAVAQEVRSLLTVLVRGLLAPDTKPRPWHSREAFGADRRFALQAGSKAALVNSAQGCSYFTQQDSFTVNVADRQITLRSILNLVHLVCALLDGDTVPVSQYQSQFDRSLFEDL